MTITPPTTIAPARRPWRTALAITVALVGTMAAIWWYQDWSAERDFQAALAETDALDPGWRLEDILAARPPILDERNAYEYILGVQGPVRSFALGGRLEKRLDGPLNVRLDAADAAALRKRMQSLGPVRRAAHMLKDMPDGRRNTDYDPTTVFSSFQWAQDLRGFAYFLHSDTLLRTCDGAGPEIAGACRAEINAARAMGDEPSLVALLIRFALMEIAMASLERATAQHELPAGELRALEKSLQREIDAPKLIAALRGERAIGLNVQDALRQGRVKPLLALPRKGGGFRDWIADWLPRSRTVDRAGYLRAMNQLVEASQLPVEQQIDEMDRISNVWSRHDAAIAEIVASSRKVIQAHARSQAKLRCAMVALAAERYRQVEGFWPRSLETLVTSKFIEAVPLDPYDGKALHWRRLGDSFIVYSVGVDRADNGGVLNRDDPIAPGADVGFQVWDKEFRGLPAPAPAQEP